MLTFTEEMLLLPGDEEGEFLPVREHAFECALAGAVLMDLAFEAGCASLHELSCRAPARDHANGRGHRTLSVR